MAKNVSNQFKNIIKNGGPFYAYAAVTFADGSQTIMNSKTDFMATGNGYSESSEAGFPLGVAISKTITLNIDNTTAYESIQDTEGRHIQDTTGEDILANKKSVEEDYYNARIVLYTEADLPDGTQERVQEGIFTVIDSVRPDEVLEITAYDDMYKADVAFYSSLTYPVSVQMLLNEVCNFCDITLGSATFKNNDYQIHQAPQNLTARQVIGYIAQIAGGNAVIDRNGRLVIKSYDLSGFDASEEISSDEIESESGIHIFSRFTSAPDIGVADVIITGVSTEVEDENGEDEVYLVGTEEYAISVDNPLITGNEQDAVNRIAESIMGLRLRPFSGNFLPDPTVEFMDLCYVIDRKDNIYKSFVTLHDFDYLGGSMFANETESPQKFGGTYYSEAAQAYQKAKEDIKNNKKQWEQAIENLSQQVANSSGLYTTKEEQPDGSTIFYMHNKPTLEESDIVWKMTAETLTVSTDGGKTWNAGITVNGEVIARILSTIGINFDWGVGGTLIIQDTDGNQTAYIDADTGEIRLTVTSLSIQGKNVNEIAADEIENFVNEVYDPEIEKLQNQIDKKSDTWYQATDPSLSWTETEESVLQDTTGEDILDTIGDPIIGILEIGKTVHDGDLWKNSDTNVEYIYQDGQWIEMPIPDAVFDEIDGKARIFVTTPVPPYSERDLWMQGPDGDIMTCVHGRESGSFVSSDWEVKQKYTDDTAVGELDLALDKQGVFDRLTNYGEVKGIFLESDGQLYINASYLMTGILKVAQPGASGKETFYANMDTGEVRIVANSFSLTNGDTIDSIAQSAVDDLDDSLTQTDIFNRLTGNKANEAIILQNGHIYINASYLNTGILQVSTASGTETLYVNVDTGEVRINATSFSLTDGRTIDSIADNAKSEAIQYTDERLSDYDPADDLTQQEVFNILTNGGITQGIYLNGGRVYVNASYIGAGTLDADRIDAKGLTVYNASGTRTLYIDNNGNVSINANSLMLSGTSVNSIANNAANSALQDAKDYTDLKIENFDPDLTQQEVFNILTNGGTTQGIYLSGGKIYINASYIGSGTISASRISSSSISAGLITADKISISDLRSLSATIGGITIGSQGLATSNGLLRFYNDGRIVFNNRVTLEAEGNGMSIRTGLTIYSSSGGDFSDGTGLINFRGIGSTTGGTYLVAQGNLNSIAKRSSSSKRYKDHIRDLDDEEALSILDIPVVVFKYKDGYLVKGDLLEGKPIPGFYAEDVEEVAPILCQYNLDGSVEDWNYRTMIPYMLKTMQIQQKRIDDLQSQIEELKTMILNMKGA